MQYLSQRLAVEPTRTREEQPSRGPVTVTQRERILAAAEQLIAEKGWSGTTIEGIVKAAGVSSVTFYEHFKGKEECIVAAFDRAVGEMRAELVAAVPRRVALDRQGASGVGGATGGDRRRSAAGAALLRRGTEGRASAAGPLRGDARRRRRRASPIRSARRSSAGWPGCCGSGSSWAGERACRTFCRG